MDLWKERLRAAALGFCIGGILATLLMLALR
jgi:hypothetical protein